MEFRILGPLEVEEDGRIVKLAGARQRGVLALLLLHANTTVSRDRLIDEVWGDEPPETASTALQVQISQLRKLLGREAIVTQAPGYLLRLQDGELDLARFEDAVTRARAAVPAEAAELLGGALALWRGPALADLDAPFANDERNRLEEQRLAALERRIDADLELGGHTQLVAELERLVGANPLREHLRGQLMLALYRSGRQADALDVYRTGRRALDEQLGLEPGEELRRIERGILEQDPALGAPVAPAAPRVPSGTVTFLFTDIEGSTRLVQELGDRYGVVLDQHHGLVREALERHGGEEIDTQGDAFFFAFRRARDAVRGAVDAQRSLTDANWPGDASVRVRIGIHTGEPGIAETGYHGLDVVRAARISGVAHGGQTLVSAATRNLVGGALEEISFEDLGEHPLKDLEQPEHVFQVNAPGIAASFPPLKTLDAARVMSIGGREDELAAAAGAALDTEDRRRRLSRRAKVIALAGALLLAAAIAGVAVALSGGSSQATVDVAPNSVAVVDDGSGKIVGDVPLGGRPVGIAVDDDGVWVTNADDGTVSRIDPETYAVVKTIGLGADVNGVAAGFGSIWVAGGNDETLYRIDPSENAIQAQLHLGDADPLRPRPIFFVTAGRDAVWVTRGNTLLRIDPKTTRVTKTVPLPGVPQDLGSGAGSIWVPLVDERLVRIDEGSATVASTTQLPAAAFMPIVVRDSLWLLLYTHAPQVEKLDPNTVTQTASVSFPNSFLTGLAGEGDKLWVVDHDKGRLWRIDANSAQAERLAATIRHFPVSIAAGHGAVWVGTQADHFR